MKKILKAVCIICVFTLTLSLFPFTYTQQKAKAMSVTDFLNTVGPMATADMNRTGILASLTMAQAILESGWGTSVLALNANALFGMKATNWSGATYWHNGTSWRAYGSWQESVNDHGSHLSTMSRYSNLVGETNYVTACHNVAADGYCTDVGYAESLINLIEKYNLTQFDGAGKVLEGASPIYIGENFMAFIRHTATGKYITDVNDNLVIADGKFDGSQMWHFYYNSDGSYSIVNDVKDKFIDVQGGNYSDGTNIWLYQGNGLDTQKFYIYFLRGNFYFRCVPSSKVFDVNASSSNLQLYGDSTGVNDVEFQARSFEILKYNLDYGNWFLNFGSGDTVYVRNVQSGMLMTANDFDVSFTNPTYGDNQKWRLNRRDNGSYEFISDYAGGKYLDVANGEMATATDVNLWYGNGLKSQGFYILPTDAEDYYVIKPCYTENVLDMGAESFDLKLYPPLINEEIPRNAQLFEIVFENMSNNTFSPVNLGEQFEAYITNQLNNYTLTDMGSYTLQAQPTTKLENQVFKFIYDASTNSYEIIGNSGFAMDVGAAAHKDASVIGMYPRNNSIAQRFRIYKIDGYYCISPIYTNRIVDVSTYNNVTVQLYGAYSAPQRNFIIEIKIEDKLVLKKDSSFIKDGANLYISSNQTVGNVISNFDNTKVSILKSDGTIAEKSDYVGTGSTVILIKDGIKYDSVTIIVKGDVDGDGKIDSTDYLRIKSAFVGMISLDSTSKKAADIDSNNIIDTTDYMRVKSHFLGNYNITNK
ncbi:MAG: hypothetical protein E7614_00215 [Ruminococcaceae bacterium]|nr:hypothetical protein [Oscillospiraceae bacterium]